MKKEIVWIDWVKFICMIFVYWCHVIQLGDNSSPINIPYGPFFVNAFFFVSGYLIFSKQLSPQYIDYNRKTFLKNGLKKNGMLMNILFKIAIPSMIFSAFDFFPKQIISGDGFSFQQFIFDTIIRGTNWFTCALTVSEIIVFFLLLTRVKNIYFYALCGLLLGILGGHLINIGFSILGNEYLPWFYKSGITACSFITLGGLFYKFQDTINKWGRINLILFIIIILNISLQGQRWSTLGGIDFIGFVISIISILAIIYLCQGFPKVKLVQYISRHTIGFYFLSGSVPYVCIKVINLIIPIGLFSFFVQLISSFFIAWFIVFLLEKYLPFVFDLRIISKKKIS